MCMQLVMNNSCLFFNPNIKGNRVIFLPFNNPLKISSLWCVLVQLTLSSSHVVLSKVPGPRSVTSGAECKIWTARLLSLVSAVTAFAMPVCSWMVLVMSPLGRVCTR